MDKRLRRALSGESGRWLIGFLVAATLLRVVGPLDRGLWFDEMWLVVETLRGSFVELLTRYQSDNHHPLYSVAAWLSVAAFGESAWALRLPAVVFGVGSVGVLWLLACRVAPRNEAILATALLTLSYHHVWFSQNARGYTMLLFWTLAATWFLLDAYERGDRPAWVAYGVCVALATFTHASAVLVALAHAAVSTVVVVRGETTKRFEQRLAPLLGLALAGLLSLLLHAGLLGDMLAFFTRDNAGNQLNEDSDWFSILWTFHAVFESVGVPLAVGYAALLVGGGVVATGVWVYARRDPATAALFVVPGVVAVAVTVLLGRSLRPRFLFHMAGFALLIVTAGGFRVVDRIAAMAGATGARWAPLGRLGVAVVLVAGSLAILPPAYTLPKQDFEGALAAARSFADSGTVATAGLTTLPYDRYYDAGFVAVETADELRALVARDAVVYVLNTLPIYLESTEPELAELLTSAEEVARFRGSLGAGDVVVLRLEAPGR